MTALERAVEFFVDHLKEWERRGYSEPIYNHGRLVEVANEVMGTATFRLQTGTNTLTGEAIYEDFTFSGYDLWHAYRYQSNIGGSRMHGEYEQPLRRVVKSSGGRLAMNIAGVVDLRLTFWLGLPREDYIRFEEVLEAVSLEDNSDLAHSSWKQFSFLAEDGVTRTVWRPWHWNDIDEDLYGEYMLRPGVVTVNRIQEEAPSWSELLDEMEDAGFIGPESSQDGDQGVDKDREENDDSGPTNDPSGVPEGGGFLDSLEWEDLVYVWLDVGDDMYKIGLTDRGVDVLRRIWEVLQDKGLT